MVKSAGNFYSCKRCNRRTTDTQLQLSFFGQLESSAMRELYIISCLCLAVTIPNFARGLQNFGDQFDPSRVPSSQLRMFSNASDVHYSPWSSWSHCSRTCGVGISTRSRYCNNRISNTRSDDSLCVGDSIDHKICRQQPCDDADIRDSREAQCSRYNNRTVAGQTAQKWTPTNGGMNPCELRCIAMGVVSGFGKVEDGTPCNGGLCLNGRCLKSGCDERLGSGVELDMCGICGGRNSACVHYKDVFHDQPSNSQSKDSRGDYREVAVIPIGSRNLEIRQKIGENILAIRDRSVSVLYYGHERSISEEKSIAGTVLRYSTEDSNLTEVLRSDGPLMTEVYVLVLLRERNTGIYYEYWLPRDQFRSHRQPIIRPEPTHRPQLTTRFIVATRFQSPFQPRLTTVKPTPPIDRRNPAKDWINVNTKSSFNYGPKRHGVFYAQFQNIHTKSSHKYSENEIPFTKAEVFILPQATPLPSPRMNLYVKTRKPVYNFYEKFRNHSYVQPVKVYQKQDPLTQHTQRDSAIFNGVDEKHKGRSDVDVDKEKLYKYKNFSQIGDPNAKWRYHFNGKGKEIEFNTYPTTPVSIAVLPLPDTRTHIKTRRGKRRGHKRYPVSKAEKEGLCAPCQRIRDQTKHFCSSDFVIRAIVLGYEFIHGETRYELEVVQSFKNMFSLLSKEYIWAPDTCRCPKLRIGKEYVLMGRSDSNYRRNESRLMVDRNSFVRNYNEKYTRRLEKLKKQRLQKCSKKDS